MSSRSSCAVITDITNLSTSIITEYGQSIPAQVALDAMDTFVTLWTEYENATNIELADARYIINIALNP